MGRIQTTFDALKAQGRKALIPYVTAGFPFADITPDLMHGMVEAGADVIELGVPFSDPMADGPVIQKAGERALALGIGMAQVLDMVKAFRQRNKTTPVVLMGYANPVERYDQRHGAGSFVRDAAAAGVDGVLVVDYPPEEWMQVQQVNLNGLFFCCREIVPLMRSQNYGRIVNIASVAGKDGNPNASAYSASKAAVIGLTKSLGKELADTGIRVNCVTPAAVKTAIFDQMSAEHIAFMLSKIPMGRFGTPEEVAAMVAWLSTEDCAFSTGAVFDLSGGRSSY